MGGRSRCCFGIFLGFFIPHLETMYYNIVTPERYSHKRTCRDSRVCRNSRFHNNCGFVDFKINQLLGEWEKITQYFLVFLVCTDY